MNEKLLTVNDVTQILGISKSAAYNIMRQLNNELKEKKDMQLFVEKLVVSILKSGFME